MNTTKQDEHTPKAAADFETWWKQEGSGMRPANGEDQEQHVKRIAQIAWANGSYREDEDARWKEHVRKWKEANGI